MGCSLKVTLFVPCLVDQAQPETARATLQIIERLGHTVVFPRQQTCCGQALFNAGFRQEAAKLARRFVRVFSDAEVVVAPSGSCVAMVKNHYEALLSGSNQDHSNDNGIASDWMSLRQRVFELSSFLADYLKVDDTGGYYPHRVSYHASCHTLRELNVVEQPFKLLKNVEGLELIDGDWKDECCGFGGIFSVKYSELSNRIADRRAQNLARGGAEVITGTDDSCLHHLQQAFIRKGAPQKAVHLARILASTKKDMS